MFHSKHKYSGLFCDLATAAYWYWKEMCWLSLFRTVFLDHFYLVSVHAVDAANDDRFGIERAKFAKCDEQFPGTEGM